MEASARRVHLRAFAPVAPTPVFASWRSSFVCEERYFSSLRFRDVNLSRRSISQARQCICMVSAAERDAENDSVDKRSVADRAEAVRQADDALSVESKQASEAERAQSENFQVQFAQQDASRVFPLAGIVGQDYVKLALLLAAVNPRVSGVCISGRRGTAKSIMARAIHALLPPIEVVKGSVFNEEPDQGGELSDKELLEGKTREGVDVIAAPFVQIPLNITEDRLIGSVDVEASVKSGKTVFQPGILARAHRGVLYIDEINLLDDGLANILLEVLSSEMVRVEREGISFAHPCKPLVIATYNPEEGPVRPHLLDRFAINLSVDQTPLSMEQRLEAVESATAFGNSSRDFIEKVADTTSETATNIVLAREYMSDVQISDKQIEYLVTEATRSMAQGHRAELYACEVAKASAAFDSRDKVNTSDLKLAVRLVVLSRALVMMDNQMDENENVPPPPPPPPPPKDEEENDTKDEEEDKEQEDPDSNEEEEPEDAPEVPQEFMFDPEGVILDKDLLQFGKNQKQGGAGSRGLIFTQDRGRYIKAMMPKGNANKLAVDATLRAAAPFQKARRMRRSSESTRKVFVEKDDMRMKRLARKAGALVVFLVDASGSMALNRMNAAKGAAIRLLTEAYQTRDKISLIPFQGDRAEVLLPPTKSISMAKNRLETMPCGGGSPLAHGIMQAVRTGINAQKTGDIGKVAIVLISDGRANVPLAISEGETIDEDKKLSKAELKEEVINIAKRLRALPTFQLLCIDTENKFVSTGVAKEIAQAAGGTYHCLPKATDAAVAGVAMSAIDAMRAL